MSHFKKYIFALTLLIAHCSTLPFRGRWAAYAIGRNSADSNYRSDEDRQRNKQINRHENVINKHNQDIKKLEKNRKLDSETKQKLIAEHRSEIEKIENRIKDLF